MTIVLAREQNDDTETRRTRVLLSSYLTKYLKQRLLDFLCLPDERETPVIYDSVAYVEKARLQAYGAQRRHKAVAASFCPEQYGRRRVSAASLRYMGGMHGASMSVTSPVLDVPAEATAQAATLVSTETPQVALASCTVPEDVVMEIDGLFTPLKALPLQRPPSTIVNASIAYIAGFVAKAVEERRTCTFCPSLHQSDGSSPVLMGLISLKSRGGLTFPKPEFVMVLVTIKKAVDIALPHIKKSNVRQQLAELILPHLE
ncbi:hypothetical protein HPB51_028587 [Rhipicephalus microplus]|uniref:Uncharacterized protein n=1 Tax=Rhipicephalus microplus TaxID=6941 RepID=A0A9J6CWH3_RHIMP|nr:hypothetical protein HPB51_028587 [Rhipicephalus microplus]